MEMLKTDTKEIEQTNSDIAADELQRLSDLQLALVGGGIGDVHFG
jgi:hypothetical protein